MDDRQRLAIEQADKLIGIVEQIIVGNPTFEGFDLRKISPEKRAEALMLLTMIELQLSNIITECQMREVPDDLVVRLKKVHKKAEQELEGYRARLSKMLQTMDR